MSIYTNLGLNEVNKLIPDMPAIRKFYPAAEYLTDGSDKLIIDFNKMPMVISFPEDDPLCVPADQKTHVQTYGFRNDFNIILRNPNSIMWSQITDLKNIPAIEQTKNFAKNYKTTMWIMSDIPQDQLQYLPDIEYNDFHLVCSSLQSMDSLPRHIHNGLSIERPGITNLAGCPDVGCLQLIDAHKLKSLKDLPATVKKLELKYIYNTNELLGTLAAVPDIITIIMPNMVSSISKTTVNYLKNLSVGHDIRITIEDVCKNTSVPIELIRLSGDYQTADGHTLRITVL